MSDADLVRMANQIAHFFAPYPEPDGSDGVRDHLEHFWTPVMRRDLQAIATQPTHGLDALVIQAIAPWPVDASH